MDPKGLRTGHFLALAGALAALGSLWRPWYSISIPPQVREALSQTGRVGQDPGLLGQLARGLAASLPSSISASGWTELEGADVATCVGAVLVVGLVLGAAGAFGSSVRVDAAAAARAVAGVGAVGVAIALVHAVHRPFDADVVHVADGLWIALAGWGATLAGGLLAAAEGDRRPERTATAFPRLEPELPPVFAATASVPPPGAAD